MGIKHTPGPWSFSVNPTGGAFIETRDVAIADVKSRGGVPHPVQEHCIANAALIAAAPDLLEALKAATNDLALAAELAKAHGDNGVYQELSSHLSIYRAVLSKAGEEQ